MNTEINSEQETIINKLVELLKGAVSENKLVKMTVYNVPPTPGITLTSNVFVVDNNSVNVMGINFLNNDIVKLYFGRDGPSKEFTLKDFVNLFENIVKYIKEFNTDCIGTLRLIRVRELFNF